MDLHTGGVFKPYAGVVVYYLPEQVQVVLIKFVHDMEPDGCSLDDKRAVRRMTYQIS